MIKQKNEKKKNVRADHQSVVRQIDFDLGVSFMAICACVHSNTNAK